MNSVTPVDTNYLRDSAKEVGNLIKGAHNAQMAEVTTFLSMQATAQTGLAMANSVGSNQLGGSYTFIG